MSTYRNIHGRSIKSISTDPTTAVSEGEIWYNTSSNVFKSILVSEAWSSSSPVIKNTYRAGSAGTQTSALLFGGSSTPPFSFFADTQEYGGSGFSSGGAMAQARWGLRGAGTQTAGLGFGGYIGPPGPPSKNSALTEEYNGTAWTTSPNSMGTGRYALGGAGTQTSALAFGGKIYPGADQSVTEEYDGSSWTGGGALPSARTRLTGCGPSNNDALAVGTLTSGVCSTYDGTSWTDTGSLGTARYRGGSSGSTSSAITYGGSTHPGVSNVTATESFDGSTWSTSPATMGTARYAFGYAGVVNSAVAMSGHTNTVMTGVTEEYAVSANVITGAAWASGPSINTARRGGNAGAVGSSTAGLIWCGVIGPGSLTNATEEYNGSSWSNSNNYPISTQNVGGAGTQAAGIGFGGSLPPQTTTANDYNGTSWTGITAMPTATWIPSGTGTAAAALSSGGTNPSGASTTTTLEWDDSAWTAGGSLSTGRRYFAGFGSQSDSLAPGGTTAPGAISAVTEKYNGSTWSSGNAMVTTIRAHAASAQSSTSAGLNMCGTTDDSTSSAATFEYDGTSWRTNASTAATRLEAFGIGDSTSAHIISGISPWPTPGAVITATEIFSGETTSLNVKTLTQS